MSETEIHIGKLNEIDLKGVPVATWCENKCKELGIKLESWHDDYIDALQSETYYSRSDVFYLVHGNKVYEVKDKELEEYYDILEIYPNNDGSYSYVMKFYNGGTCLSECLEEKLNKI